MTDLFLYRDGLRSRIHTLRPYLRHALEQQVVMDETRIEDKSLLASCRWVGWGITKGVTHRTNRVSVLGTPDTMKQGLHAELVQGFADVDEPAQCYEPHAPKGFGGFIRWVYFTDPDDPCLEGGVIGIDWNGGGNQTTPTSGIATSMTDVMAVAQCLIEQGLSPDAELALLDWNMLEREEIRTWRRAFHLYHLEDWSRADVFAPHGRLCVRCGSETNICHYRHCYHCGVRFTHVSGGTHGLENHLS